MPVSNPQPLASQLLDTDSSIKSSILESVGYGKRKLSIEDKTVTDIIDEITVKKLFCDFPLTIIKKALANQVISAAELAAFKQFMQKDYLRTFGLSLWTNFLREIKKYIRQHVTFSELMHFRNTHESALQVILALHDWLIAEINYSRSNWKQYNKPYNQNAFHGIMLLCASLLGGDKTAETMQLIGHSEKIFEFHYKYYMPFPDTSDWQEKQCEEEGASAIHHAIIQAMFCLNDREHCEAKLKELEEELAARLSDSDTDLSEYDQIDGIIKSKSSLLWPVPSLYRRRQGLHHKANRALHKLLLKLEQQFGLNTASDAPMIFYDFVSGAEADACRKDGNIFVEDRAFSQCFHGVYSHRIQWYIILATLKELLVEIPHTQEHVNTILIPLLAEHWARAVDLNFIPNNKPGFRSPEMLHAYLLNTGLFPQLRRYTRKVFADSVDKISKAQGLDQADRPQVNAAEIITVNAWIDEIFSARALLKSTPPIERYQKNALRFFYTDARPSDANIHPNTCIYIKKRNK